MRARGGSQAFRRIAAGACGALAVMAAAWTLAAPQQAVSWDRAREAIGKYRTMLDSSGLVEVGSNLPPNIRRDDLAALCAGRQEAVKRAQYAGTSQLRGVVPGDDPYTAERRAVFERYLGSVASFTGDADTAVAHFQSGRDAVLAVLADAPSLKSRYLTMELALGVGHMRQGESANCLVMGSADRCLFPLRPGGQHMHPEQAEAAIVSFTRYLKVEPEDLGVRWLLNLAYMLVGRYPQDVPAEYLLKAELFRSDAEAPRFTDVGRAVKLGRPDIAGGTIADDFNGDGLVDVVLTSVDYCSPVRLFRNRGDGTFEDRTEAAGLLPQLGGINTIQTDYNNDGRLDIFIMRGGWEVPMRNSLLRGNGGRHLTDVTAEAGLLDAKQATHSVVWADIDNDGWLDLFVCARAVGEPAVPQPRRRHVRGHHRARRRRLRGLHEGRRGRRLRQQRLRGPVPVEHVRRELPLQEQRERHVHERRRDAGRGQAVRELPDLVLRLRQRRLARPVRRRRTRTRSRSSSSTI